MGLLVIACLYELNLAIDDNYNLIEKNFAMNQYSEEAHEAKDENFEQLLNMLNELKEQNRD